MSSFEDVYELSPVQHGMLFESLAAGDSGLHMVQLVYDLGEVNASALRGAWQAACDRHAALRTSFHWEELEKPLQVVRRLVEAPLATEDWRSLPVGEREAALERLLDDDRRRGFDLDVAPLFRLRLLRLGGAHNWFVWSFHHALFEGWSASLILDDVLAAYRARANGGNAEHRGPRPDPPRFRDYVRWLQEQPTSEARACWSTELAGFRAATPLPYAARPSSSSVQQVLKYDARTLRLSPAETEELTSFARREGVTTSTLVHGAWATLLGRATGERDVVFGTMVSGRSAPVPEIDRMVGLLINLLPTRAKVAHDVPVAEWLRQLQGRQARLREHGHLPLVQVKAWSEVPAGQPLFETLVVFENWFGDVTLRDASDALEVHGVRGRHGGPGFPLALVAWPGEGLTLSVSYDSDLYTGETADRLLGQLATVLRGFACMSGVAPACVPLTTPEEERALVEAWNPAPPDPPRDACVHHLFALQVDRTPDALAVTFRGESLTYRELHARAGRLARRLRLLGVGPDTRVGICVERSIDTVVAIWGVLLAGGAYVPLDPTVPTQRLSFVLEDSTTSALVTSDALLARMPPDVRPVIVVDRTGTAPPAAPNGELARDARPDNLAYVTYTSGSTGRPKGSMVTHAGLVNAFAGWDEAYRLRDVRSHLALASFAVDVFTADVVRAHLSGGRLVLAPHEVLFSPPRLADLLIGERIEYAEFVPHVLGPVIDELESSGRTLPDLLFLVVGSDVWLGSEWERARRVCSPAVRRINAYGLNETSVDCTFYEGRDGDVPPRAWVPIGKPYRNHRIYVLDERYRPVPAGVPGELWISGPGVARGYWNRPAITAERFVPDPFAVRPGERMCRTGDRVRVLPDGNVELLGRVDHQVKVRAFRVEPGEVESVLQCYPAVRQSVAGVRDDEAGDRRLVAWIVCDGPRPDPVELRRFVAERLPGHMVPSAFVFLDRMPLTSNGLKVDRAALPSPVADARAYGPDVVAPRTETERRLAELWCEVLPVDRVGVHDNFMDLGGHSLLLIRVLDRIEREHGVRMLPGELVFPTLGQLAATLDERRTDPPAARPRGLLWRAFRRR